MATLTLAYRMKDQQELVIPNAALTQLGLKEGDEFQIKIETLDLAQTKQEELRLKADRQFIEADTLEREPGKPLTDAFEAEWAQGMEEKARRMGLMV